MRRKIGVGSIINRTGQRNDSITNIYRKITLAVRFSSNNNASSSTLKMKSLNVNDEQKQQQQVVEAAPAALDHQLMYGLLLLLPGCFHANNIAGDGQQQQQAQCNMIGAASSTGVAGHLVERAGISRAVCVIFSNYRYGSNSNGKKHHHKHYINSNSGNTCNNQVAVVGGDAFDDWCD